MFERSSRYFENPAYNVEKPLTGDKKVGRTGPAIVKVNDFRPVPFGVESAVEHELIEGERLDNLATRFYRKPTKWWRICDANPSFDNPLAFLGDDPFIIAKLTVNGKGDDKICWNPLLNTLRTTPGVDDVRFVVSYHETGPIEHCLWITFNRLLISINNIANAIERNKGFTVEGHELLGRSGKKIAIPAEGR